MEDKAEGSEIPDALEVLLSRVTPFSAAVLTVAEKSTTPTDPQTDTSPSDDHVAGGNDAPIRLNGFHGD